LSPLWYSISATFYLTGGKLQCRVGWWISESDIGIHFSSHEKPHDASQITCWTDGNSIPIWECHVRFEDY